MTLTSEPIRMHPSPAHTVLSNEARDARINRKLNIFRAYQKARHIESYLIKEEDEPEKEKDIS